MTKFSVKLCFVFLLSLSCSSYGAAFLEHINGQPYVWKPSGAPITYRVETGPLTPSVDNTQAKALVAQAFSAWENVFGAQEFTFTEGLSLGEDITVSNYENYIGFDSSGSFINKTLDTVVIFDEDGSIINDLFEPVAPGSGSTVLGIASPGLFNDSNFEITAGFVLLNGAVTGSNNDIIRGTATHEIGHMLNLAHTQLNEEQARNGLSSDDDVVPTMFPFLPNDATVLTSLELDDQFSMSLLYPDTQAISTRNEIRGRVLRKDESGVRAVNVICRSNSNPLETAVSYVSDQSQLDNGNYVCGLLPAGDYSIQVEAIRQAINTYNPNPPFIETEFYNGSNEGFDSSLDLLNDLELVNVSGSSDLVENIDIVLNNNGRLFSGQSVSSQTFEQFSVREYFINVPSGSKSLTVNLTWANSADDLDLFVKCAPEFSISAAAPNLYGQTDAFSDEESTNFETITLNKSSSPSLTQCQYRIIVQSFGFQNNETVNFNLNVEIDGKTPSTLISKAEDINTLYQGNEYIVGSKVMKGKFESFDVSSLSFQESILENMDNVSMASLYVDSNNNKRLDQGDRFLKSTSSFNTSDLSFMFDGIFFSVEDNKETRIFVTYTLQPQSSGFSLITIGLVFLLFLLGRANRSDTKSLLRVSAVTLLLTLPLSCQKPQFEYKPVLINDSSIAAVGQTYNDQFLVDIDESGQFDSVTDFFD